MHGSYCATVCTVSVDWKLDSWVFALPASSTSSHGRLDAVALGSHELLNAPMWQAPSNSTQVLRVSDAEFDNGIEPALSL